MIKKFVFILIFCCCVVTQAQYTDIINSNRPGFSESPYSVGTGVYQFESTLFYRKAEAIKTFSNPQALGLQLHFRTALFLEKLELNVITALQKDDIAFKNIFVSSYNQIGLGQLTLGAKYLVFVPEYEDKGKQIRSWNKRHGFDMKRWIPHVAGYVGVNIGSVLNDYHQKGGISPKIGVLLQNEFSKQFNFVTNVYYDYMFSEYSEWSYVLTATYNFNDTWSGFVEHQALFNPYENQSNLGGGLAYLFNNDMQINISLRATFQENTTGMYGSLGFSYRLDRHRDEFVELDEFGNKIEAPEKKTYNKGFFGRMLDKLTGLFKKKEKVLVDVEGEDGKEPKEVEVGAGERTRKKSVLKELVKSDKKQTKEKLKAEKKAKKKAEKQLRREERQLEKEKRREQKEKEKLEKELKKIEEDLKKQKELEKLEEEQRKKEEEKLLEQDKKPETPEKKTDKDDD